jgi:gas vesicle protein
MDPAAVQVTGETDMSRQDAGGGTVLLAFLAGAISGAAVALLIAPAAGEETRQFLTDKARESRERANAAAREGRAEIRRHKDPITAAIDRGREAYNKTRHGGETA